MARAAGKRLQLLRTIGFHLINFCFSIVLLILNSLSLGGTVFFLLPIATCSTHLLRHLVAKLWRLELQLHGFLTRRKDYSQYNRQHRQMRVTGPTMVVSLVYFVWFRAFFNLLFSAVPIVLWVVALTMVLQIAPSGLELNGSTLWGLVVAALAYWIGNLAAWASVMVSETVMNTVFGGIDERADEDDVEERDDVHTALLANQQRRNQSSYGYGASGFPPSREQLQREHSGDSLRTVLVQRDSCRQSVSPPPPRPPPPPQPPFAPIPPQLPPLPSQRQSSQDSDAKFMIRYTSDSRDTDLPMDELRTRRLEDHLQPDIVEVKCCGFKAMMKKHHRPRYQDRSTAAAPDREGSHQDYEYPEAHVYATPVPSAETKHTIARVLDSEEPAKDHVPVADLVWDVDIGHRRNRSASDDDQQLLSRLNFPNEMFGKGFEKNLHRSISDVLDLATQKISESRIRPCHRHQHQHPCKKHLARHHDDDSGFSCVHKQKMHQFAANMKLFSKQFPTQKSVGERYEPSAPNEPMEDLMPPHSKAQTSETTGAEVKKPKDRIQNDVPAIKPLALSTRQPPSSPPFHKSRSDETSSRQGFQGRAAPRTAGVVVRAVPRRVHGDDQEKQVLTSSTDSLLKSDDDGKRVMRTSKKYQSAPASKTRERERRKSWDANMAFEFQGRYTSARDATSAVYDKSFDFTFAESPETIQSLDISPVYRGASNNLLETGLPASYTGFSPLASPTGARLSLEEPTQYDGFKYDVLSPVAATRDPKDEFPTELPEVYRSIRYNGQNSSGADSEWNRMAREEQTQRDKVHFNAFAPPCMFPSPKAFMFTVWAFLLNQKHEMKEQASVLDATAEQLSVDTKLDFRRGALVHVVLEVPPGFRVLNGETQRFEWQGKITNVQYEVECTENAPVGQVLFKARIVVGSEVALLRSYVFVAKQRPQDRGLEARILESTLDVMPKTYREIPYESLKLKQLVGKGYFGDAYQATLDGEEVVVKTIRASELGETSEQIVKEFQHEAALLSMFGHHPCIVPFRGACTDFSHPLCLVTKYLPFGSLEDQFRTENAGQTLSLMRRQSMLRDAAAGILNIHEGGFVHRDIAARNCLVDDNFRVRICDFGLCRRVDMTYGGSLVRDGIGPLKYMAPESLQPPHAFSYNSDSYMFGVLMWETMTMSEPFASMSPFQAAVRVLEGDRLPIPQQLPDRLKKLMAFCFHEDPSRRPSMAKILLSLDDACAWPEHDVLSGAAAG